jgi:DNA-binding cell septation regulator SpoVG
MKPRVTGVHFTASPTLDASDGRLGWVRIELDGWLEIDGIVLRRTSRGELRVCFPSKVDGSGIRRYFARPLTDEARAAIQEQVINWLQRERRLVS